MHAELNEKLCNMITNSKEYPKVCNFEQSENDLYFKGYFDRE